MPTTPARMAAGMPPHRPLVGIETNEAMVKVPLLLLTLLLLLLLFLTLVVAEPSSVDNVGDGVVSGSRNYLRVVVRIDVRLCFVV